MYGVVGDFISLNPPAPAPEAPPAPVDPILPPPPLPQANTKYDTILFAAVVEVLDTVKVPGPVNV